MDRSARFHPRTTAADWAVAAAFATLAAALHGGRDLWLGRVVLDERMIHMPNGYWTWQCLRAGIPPLWNPFAFGGMPHLAGHYTAALYPPVWLAYALLEPFRAFAVLQAAHYAWAGLGAWVWLAQGWRLRPGAALIGASGFMLSGFMIAHEPHGPMIWSAAWTPWVLWALRRVWAGDRGAGPLAAATVALQLVSGYMQVVVMTLLVAGVDAAAALWGARAVWPLGLRRGVAWGAAAALSMGLAAVQWMSTREILSETYRSRVAFESFVEDAFPLPQWVMLGWPLVFGADERWSVGERFFGAGHQPEVIGAMAAAIWVGVLWLGFLSGGAAEAPRRRDVRVWAGVALAAAAILPGRASPLTRLLYHVPVLDLFRVQSRWLLVLNLALAALAAAGWHRWLTALEATDDVGARSAEVRRALRWGWALLASAPLALWGWLGATARTSELPIDWHWFFTQWLTPTNPAVWLPLAFAGAVLLSAGASRRFASVRRGLPALLVLTVLLEQGILTANVVRRGGVRGADAAPPTNETVAWLQRQADVPALAFRVLPLTDADIRLHTETLLFQLPQVFGIRSASGNWPLVPANWSRLLRIANIGSTEDPLGLLARPWLLNMLGVRYLLVGHRFDPNSETPDVPLPGDPALLARIRSDPTFRYLQVRHRTARGTTILENPGALGPAWLVRRVEPVADAAEAIARLWQVAEFDPADRALVEGRSDEALRAGDWAPGTATVIDRRPDRLWLDVEVAGERGFLVVNEPWSPGWWARIDGRLEPLRRVNGVAMGLPLPEGRHRLYLRYLPNGFKLGLYVSAAAGLAWLAWAGLAWRLAPRARTSMPRRVEGPS